MNEIAIPLKLKIEKLQYFWAEEVHEDLVVPENIWDWSKNPPPLFPFPDGPYQGMFHYTLGLTMIKYR